MVSSRKRALLRAFVETFPPLKVALRVNDIICLIVQSIFKFIWWCIKTTFNLVYSTLKQIFFSFARLLRSTFGWNLTDPRGTLYKRIDGTEKIEHIEPIPHRDSLIKRSLTYHGGLILGTLLYLFVYYVLIKHHTFTSITAASLIMLAYLVILENSHNIRSILMLCLPIMFTNRGRGLVFCCMLAIMVSGPMKNSQLNVSELHKSLTCCKQYLIIRADVVVDESIVQNIVRVENIIYSLVDNIKQFVSEIKEKFRILIELAITVEQYITKSIEELKAIVNVCNVHTQDVYKNCLKTFDDAQADCLDKLGSSFSIVCSIARHLKHLCSIVKLPGTLCQIPRVVVQFIDKTVGQNLRTFLLIIENEFYFDVEIKHNYSFNGTKSKSFKRVIQEIQFDVEKKFWYIHMVTRVFNMISLILVIWILITATLYQMHFLDDIKYDNMYIDDHLSELEKQRKVGRLSSSRKSDEMTDDEDHQRIKKYLKVKKSKDKDDDDCKKKLFISSKKDSSSQEDYDDYNTDLDKQVKKKFLFPMTNAHVRRYLKPFSFWMNDTEMSKLYVASFIWVVIIGYIFFFVLLDYALYQLIVLMDKLLKEILFLSDLPLVDVSSKEGDEVIRFNRTYLKELRMLNLATRKEFRHRTHRKGSLSGMYHRLMDLIEANIPDDIAILDSLEKCLPHPSEPNYNDYKNLGYLALFTFGAVILEAYALRTRHCIANLYYPARAKRRAIWLYRKMLAEKPKYEGEPNKIADKLLETGIEVLD